MSLKENTKTAYLSMRIDENIKRAFQQVAENRKTKVAQLLTDLILTEIEKENISLVEVAENQISIFDEMEPKE